MSRTAITNGKLVLSDGTIARGTITLSDGRIEAVLPENVATGDTAIDDAEVIDAGGQLVTPGLIDVHVHGARGHAFDEADHVAIGQITRYFARRGVTTLQASLVSASTENLRARVSRLAPVLRQPNAQEATIVGVHLEGPFLSSAQRGAHSGAVLRAPTDADRALLSSVAAQVTMITVAPEIPGVLELMETLTATGMVVAIGHSNARGAALDDVQRAGARHITHLWSGQSALVREGPWRVPGLLEASLASTGFTAEIIADGKHLPPALLEIARRCLGDDLIVVSDATTGTGMPNGYSYQLGEVRCRVEDRVGMVEGEDSFGGSTTGLDGMLRYLVGELEWPIADVIRMMTSTPARVLGIEHDTGSLSAGKSADVVIWDDDFEPAAVMLRGIMLPPEASAG